MLETYIEDAKERLELTRAHETVACVKQKADWAMRWTAAEKAPFAARLVAFAGAVDGRRGGRVRGGGAQEGGRAARRAAAAAQRAAGPVVHGDAARAAGDYVVGVGGSCADRSPPAGYWCAADAPRRISMPNHPSGLVVNRSHLPHLPYQRPAGDACTE